MANKERKFYGTGRRKSSSARVTLVPGKGNITVNGRDVHEYFPHEVLVMDLMQPLEVTDNKETFDVIENAAIKTMESKAEIILFVFFIMILLKLIFLSMLINTLYTKNLQKST